MFSKACVWGMLVSVHLNVLISGGTQGERKSGFDNTSTEETMTESEIKFARDESIVLNERARNSAKTEKEKHQLHMKRVSFLCL